MSFLQRKTEWVRHEGCHLPLEGSHWQPQDVPQRCAAGVPTAPACHLPRPVPPRGGPSECSGVPPAASSRVNHCTEGKERFLAGGPRTLSHTEQVSGPGLTAVCNCPALVTVRLGFRTAPKGGPPWPESCLPRGTLTGTRFTDAVGGGGGKATGGARNAGGLLFPQRAQEPCPSPAPLCAQAGLVSAVGVDVLSAHRDLQGAQVVGVSLVLPHLPAARTHTGGSSTR